MSAPVRMRKIPATHCGNCGSPNRANHWKRGAICDDCGRLWPMHRA